MSKILSAALEPSAKLYDFQFQTEFQIKIIPLTCKVGAKSTLKGSDYCHTKQRFIHQYLTNDNFIKYAWCCQNDAMAYNRCVALEINFPSVLTAQLLYP